MLPVLVSGGLTNIHRIPAYTLLPLRWITVTLEVSVAIDLPANSWISLGWESSKQLDNFLSSLTLSHKSISSRKEFV